MDEGHKRGCKFLNRIIIKSIIQDPSSQGSNIYSKQLLHFNTSYDRDSSRGVVVVCCNRNKRRSELLHLLHLKHSLACESVCLRGSHVPLPNTTIRHRTPNLLSSPSSTLQSKKNSTSSIRPAHSFATLIKDTLPFHIPLHKGEAPETDGNISLRRN